MDTLDHNSETSMQLPNPDELKAMLSTVSVKVTAITEDLAKLAESYGVHGRQMRLGDCLFQVTRLHEKWSVYMFPPSGTPRNLTAAKMDDKLLFLEHADEFVKDYQYKIVGLYQMLLKVSAREEGEKPQ